jgi:hypothetical protein
MFTTDCLLLAFALCGLASGHGVLAQSRQVQGTESPALSLASSDVPPMPPAPRGSSTTFGGAITNLDPVRDRLTLRLPNQHPMAIFFDERTAVYRDGKRIRLSDLGDARNASVETTLDGSRLFALSIHLLSNADQNELQGRVVAFNPTTGDLQITSDNMSAPFTFRVDRDAQLVREGQAQSATAAPGTGALAPGTLVSLHFVSSGQQRPEVSRIRVLALPGMTVIFKGTVSSLDEHLGRMVLIDARNGNSYPLSFNSSILPSAQTIHLGDKLSVTADYDGTRYVARDIAALPR